MTGAGGRRLAVVQGNITGIEADAVVNAANRSLLGGGGEEGVLPGG